MKRSTILLTAFVFMVGTFSSAPVSYAAGIDDFLNHNHSNEVSEADVAEEQQETGNTEDQSSTVENTSLKKDTSWFDYDNPKKSYKITTAAELMGLASLVNENQVESWKPSRLENFEGVTFILMNDIKLAEKWTPIGTGTASYFAGTFDGNGHTVSGITINSNVGYAGFFGYLKGQVKNLTVQGKIVSGDGSCGGIAGQLDSEARIINCTSDIDITAKDKTGGIAGFNKGGVIESSINIGNISGTYKVGGIVGENWGGEITMCGNKGKISSSQRGVATYGTGGVAGRSVSADAKVTESFNIGTIISNTEATGGVVGYTNAAGSEIISCYNNGEIIIKGNQKEVIQSWVGGVVGIVGCKGIKIHSCYASKGATGADITGGVVGRYINDPNDSSENLIHKNYYVSDYYHEGIGQVEDKAKLNEAVLSVSSGALNKMANSLGAGYINDTSGRYGNSGYPVLEWQSPVTDEERSYMTTIPKEIQKEFDEYLINTASDVKTGSFVISFLDPDSYISNAVSQYHQDHMEEDN
ncbi:MAG: GLUG motif-containing protein [Bacillota bacterium]|nr:GLUG motif-containing protein [Bacillota bacterium]